MVVLHFYFGASATAFLTLTEMVTLPAASFLFVFKQRVPDKAITAVLIPTISNERSDKFSIDVDAIFAGCKPGQWMYTVYEQEDATNLDPANAGAELERGIVQLHPETPFAFIQRETHTTFIQP